MNQHGPPNVMGISPMMQQSSPQQPQSQQSQGSTSSNPHSVIPPTPPHPPTQSKSAESLDNISKVKTLAIPLRESLGMTLKTAAQLVQYNNLIDNGPIKGIDNSNQAPPRFDKHLEEFFSICDQIELHLKTAILCLHQNSASQRYLPTNVMTASITPIPINDNNNALSYPQYLATVRQQIGYAKDIHDTLICAAQNISPSDYNENK